MRKISECYDISPNFRYKESSCFVSSSGLVTLALKSGEVQYHKYVNHITMFPYNTGQNIRRLKNEKH